LAATQTTTRPYEASFTRKRLDARRVYSALVVLPILYLLVRYAPKWGFFTLVAATALLALAEFYRLHFQKQSVPSIIGLCCGGLLLISMQWPDVISPAFLLTLAIFIALISRLFAREALSRSLVDAAVMILGVGYVAGLLGHALLIRGYQDGEWLIFFLVAVTWAGDTGAYYAGIALGKHKLAPRISPNKTVEGLAGGILLAVLMAMTARWWFLPTFSIGQCIVLGLLLTGAGVMGDLVESAIKRSAGVKDSGSMIPGHGGMLDRLDSMLFTAPTLYYYLAFVKG
jgi:phosphatidate cytidylyltransferase